MRLWVRTCSAFLFFMIPVALMANASMVGTPSIPERGAFDMSRWDYVMDNIRTRALSNGISGNVIKATLGSPAFIPHIVHSDKNQAEFKLTLDGYLTRTVSDSRILNGKKMRARYPTMLSRV